MGFLPLAILFAVSPLLLWLLWTFNRLVQVEFERYPEQWRADGRPLFLPLRWDTRWTFRRWLATQRCALAWALRQPKWSHANSEVSKCARRLRILFWLWILVAIPVFAASAIVASQFH
jgi:hypothetical protein